MKLKLNSAWEAKPSSFHLLRTQAWRSWSSQFARVCETDLTSQASGQAGPAKGHRAEASTRVRVRSSEKSQPFLRTEWENRVDLAGAGVGQTRALLWSARAGWEESVQGPHLPPAASVGGRCRKT